MFCQWNVQEYKAPFVNRQSTHLNNSHEIILSLMGSIELMLQ